MVATTPTATPEQSNAKALLDRMLDTYGLSSLKDWAWSQVVLNRSPDEIVAFLYERPEFKARFPAIEARRKAGLPPITAEEYVTYEGAAHQAMRAANMPPGFWDDHDDFTKLIAADVSIDELNTRITAGYQKVAQAPTEVRDAYANYFGINGDAALAASFLDPKRSAAVLDDQVRAATFGGTGTRFGFRIGATMARDYGKRDFSVGEMESGFAQAAKQRPLTEETITESEDFGLNEGIEAAFGGDATTSFERRLARRKADSEGSGSAAASETGAIGLGQTWP
jgi:hypothetical protein